MCRYRSAVGFIFLIILCTRAAAENEYGAQPQEICALCHSLDGVSKMARFPKLAGQKRAYIKKQFLDFRSRLRSNDDEQMAAITQEINDKDIDTVSAYFSQLAPPVAAIKAANDDQRELYVLGEKLYTRGKPGQPPCSSCHSQRDSDAPWLDAQHAAYLTKQLEDFRSGARANDADSTMRTITTALGDLDIKALALYLSTTQLRGGESP